MFGTIKGKLQGKSIDSEIDEAFDNTGTDSTGTDSYSKKVLEGSQKQNSRFGMSDAYFHEKPESPQQPQQQVTESQDFTQSQDAMSGQPAAEMPDVDFPSSNDLRISDPTKMDDPHLSVPAPKMMPPLLAQKPAQNQSMQQSIQSAQPPQQAVQAAAYPQVQQPQQMPLPEPLSEPKPIALAQSPADTNPLSRRIESLLLEVRTLRAQNEQILELVQHLEKRSI